MKLLKPTYAILICLGLLAFIKPEDKQYTRTYYNDGTIESEGWIRYSTRTDYWTFYHPNGNKSQQGFYSYGKKDKYWFFFDEHRIRTKEGRFKDNSEIGWWLFYDPQGRINHKCQLTNGIKDGYCLKYKDAKLISAEKYSKGEKIKEWTSFRAFTHENSLSDLK